MHHILVSLFKRETRSLQKPTAGARLAEVFWTCASHALSTEAEEIMGLLLGDITVRTYAVCPVFDIWA